MATTLFSPCSHQKAGMTTSPTSQRASTTLAGLEPLLASPAIKDTPESTDYYFFFFFFLSIYIFIDLPIPAVIQVTTHSSHDPPKPASPLVASSSACISSSEPVSRPRSAIGRLEYLLAAMDRPPNTGCIPCVCEREAWGWRQCSCIERHECGEGVRQCFCTWHDCGDEVWHCSCIESHDRVEGVRQYSCIVGRGCGHRE